jgi:DNA-binding beta-propeller fold protein YncE
VNEFTRDGRWVRAFGGRPGDRDRSRRSGESRSESGDLADPVALEAAPSGEVLVLDAAENAVKVFSPDGRLLRSFGSYGRGASELDCPHDLALLADSGNRRIQRFLLDGTPLGPLGGDRGRGDGPGELRDPTGVAVLTSGEILVADHYGHRIQVFDREGREILPRRLHDTAVLRYPTRIAVRGDRCYVTCRPLSRVVALACP